MKTAFYSLVALITLIACGATTEKTSQQHVATQSSKTSTEDSSKVTTQNSQQEETAQQTSKVVADYLELKDALVKSDSRKARTACGKLMVSLAKERMNPEIAEAANSLADSQDIEKQREYFKIITDKLIAIYNSKEDEQGLFVQYCPMAFDNTGASWLSSSSEIRNPYFGDKMLKCGRVTGEL